MSRHRFVSIVLGALALTPVGLGAQEPPIPKPLASFSCFGISCFETRTSPNGRFIASGISSSGVSSPGLEMYAVASKDSWILSEGEAVQMSWSARSDILVFLRRDPSSKSTYARNVWTIPVDPNTGEARGPARRISIGAALNPSISDDGRWVAYLSSDSASWGDLLVVPATGGPTRVIAQLGRTIGRFLYGTANSFWGADGKSIYVQVRPSNGLSADVMKFSIDGSTPPQLIRPRGERLVGMTQDRAHLVLIPHKNLQEMEVAAGDRGTVIDTLGREVGHFALPLGELTYDRVLGDSAIVWVTTTDHRSLEIKSISGGAAQRLPLVGESNDGARWSPDGKRIAFQVRETSRRTVLAVSNAGGSDLRLFRDVQTSASPVWSPDSRLLAFEDQEQHTLSVLDLSTGTQRALLTDTVNLLAGARWRADGRSLVAIILVLADPPGRPPGMRWMEVSLNGRRRTLMEMFPAPRYRFGLGDKAYLIQADSIVVIKPLGPGPARPFATVPSGAQLRWRAADSRWVAAQLLVPGRNGNNQIALFSLATGALKVLNLPFAMLMSPFQFVPGDNSLLVIGAGINHSDQNMDYSIFAYRVPLNGDTPNVVGDIGTLPRYTGTMPFVSVSPDGKFFLYSVQRDASTTSLGLISLRGAIPSTISRPLRP